MIDSEEIKRYLPKYLSAEASDSLFEELKAFPDNIGKRFYGDMLQNEKNIFQGDGIRDLLVINLPENRIEPYPALVISNTCDLATENKRLIEPKVLYCPIIRISKFEKLLRDKNVKEERILQYLREIKEQKISSIFYLPQGGSLPEDCLVLFDSINNCQSNSIINAEVPSRRLFSLSNYGFYVLLFKLSIHFTRIRESVQRG